MTASPATIFVDADNTLWDTDGVFAEAQLALLSEIEAAAGRTATGERLAFIRGFDQALAEQHHKGLRYPPRLLVQATALGLGGRAPDKAVRAALLGAAHPIDERAALGLERDFLEAIGRTPSLRPGVIEGLDALRAAGCLVLVLTEGSLERGAANR